MILLRCKYLCEDLVEWMKLKVSSIWEPSTYFPATVNESDNTSEGTSLIKGISDKATKTCAGIGHIQLSADFLACQCCKTSSVKLALNGKI